MGKRIIAIVAAVVLATVGTLVLVVYVRSAEDRALAGEEIVEVLVVDSNVSAGTPAEALADRTRVERVPVKVRAEGSVDSLESLEGRVASGPLVAGEQVVAARFVEPDELAQVEIPDGLLQVSVELSPDRVIGGVIEPGDTVAVFSSFTDVESEVEGTDEDADEAQARKDDTTHLTLHKVLVTNVQGERGAQSAATAPTIASTAQDDEGENEEDQGAPTEDLIVTVALDAPSAERLVFTAEHGTVWLALEPDDAPEEGTRVQTKGTIYQ